MGGSIRLPIDTWSKLDMARLYMPVGSHKKQEHKLLFLKII